VSGGLANSHPGLIKDLFQHLAPSCVRQLHLLSTMSAVWGLHAGRVKQYCEKEFLDPNFVEYGRALLQNIKFTSQGITFRSMKMSCSAGYKYHVIGVSEALQNSPCF
jgi:hypothetical protein